MGQGERKEGTARRRTEMGREVGCRREMEAAKGRGPERQTAPSSGQGVSLVKLR